ncbi:MAG TPA: hypothetical protein VIP52_14930, partial [Candidatus Dormibacteraeota bacterium]
AELAQEDRHSLDGMSADDVRAGLTAPAQHLGRAEATVTAAERRQHFIYGQTCRPLQREGARRRRL